MPVCSCGIFQTHTTPTRYPDVLVTWPLFWTYSPYSSLFGISLFFPKFIVILLIVYCPHPHTLNLYLYSHTIWLLHITLITPASACLISRQNIQSTYTHHLHISTLHGLNTLLPVTGFLLRQWCSLPHRTARTIFLAKRYAIAYPIINSPPVLSKLQWCDSGCKSRNLNTQSRDIWMRSSDVSPSCDRFWRFASPPRLPSRVSLGICLSRAGSSAAWLGGWRFSGAYRVSLSFPKPSLHSCRMLYDFSGLCVMFRCGININISCIARANPSHIFFCQIQRSCILQA